LKTKNLKGEAMSAGTKISTSRAVIDEAHQCRFTTLDGRRCANPQYGSATGYCVSHERLAQKHSAAQAAKIAAELLDHCDDLQTLQGIHNAFANLYRLFAAKKISRADAFVLAYINRSLVRTAGLLDARSESDDDDTARLIWSRGPQERKPVESPAASSDFIPGEQSVSASSDPYMTTQDSAESLPPAPAQPQSAPPPAPQRHPVPSFDDLPCGAYLVRRRSPRRYTPKYRGF
jgi:hypothetical protein